MSATAVLCSGQGFQNASMFDLMADAPEAAPVFEAAKLLLNGKDPRQLAREASSEALHADKVGQILCCTQALAAWVVVGRKVPRPLIVAGYSVGELAAWVSLDYWTLRTSWISLHGARPRWMQPQLSRVDWRPSEVSREIP